MNENNKPTKQPIEQTFNDKLMYSTVLVERICITLTAIDQGRPGIEELDRLYTILLPEVQAAIEAGGRTKERRTRLFTILSEIPQTVHPQSQISEKIKTLEKFFENPQRPHSNIYRYVGGYNIPAERESLNGADILPRLCNMYVAIELKDIIAELHKRKLLLFSEKAVEIGGLLEE